MLQPKRHKFDGPSLRPGWTPEAKKMKPVPGDHRAHTIPWGYIKSDTNDRIDGDNTAQSYEAVYAHVAKQDAQSQKQVSDFAHNPQTGAPADKYLKELNGSTHNLRLGNGPINSGIGEKIDPGFRMSRNDPNRWSIDSDHGEAIVARMEHGYLAGFHNDSHGNIVSSTPPYKAPEADAKESLERRMGSVVDSATWGTSTYLTRR